MMDVPSRPTPSESRNEALLRLMVEHVRRHYARDVALVLLYGSMTRDRAAASSDLDLVFIPRTNRGRLLAKTFILEDVGYDFYPVEWERLERQAEGREAFLTYVRGARVVFAASPEEEWRYAALCRQAEELTRPGAASARRAALFFDRAGAALGRVALARDMAETRAWAGALVEGVADALHVMNGAYDRPGRGWTRSLYALPHRPDDLRERIEAVAKAGGQAAAFDAARDLLAAARQCHRRFAATVAPMRESAPPLAGVLEELHSNWHHKIIEAAAAGDGVEAFVAGAAGQRMLDEVAANTGVERIDLMGDFRIGGLASFPEALARTEDDLRALYARHGVPVREYHSLAEFEQALEEQA